MSAIHLCIDMQIGEIGKFRPATAQHFRSAVERTIEALGQQGIPTLYVAYKDPCHTGNGSPPSDTLGEFSRVQRELLRWDRESALCITAPDTALVAPKSNYSARQSPHIDRHIITNGHNTILLSGVWESTSLNHHHGCCVTQSALSFRQAGYEVTIVAEATNAPHRERLSLEERREIHRLMGVKISPLAEILSRPNP